MQPIIVRLYRLGLLVAAVLLLRTAIAPGLTPLRVEQVRDYFPHAASLGAAEPVTGLQRVLDAAGVVLGSVAQTAPLSDDCIGYSGPTNTLIAADSTGRVLGIRILHSDDTPEHVAEVVGARHFFAPFKELHLGEAAADAHLDAVSGATLTSAAIADGVLARLGQKAGAGSSRRFPTEITLAEVQQLEPRATSLRPSLQKIGEIEVLDAAGAVLAVALRSAPQADTVIGYKGPSDTLMLLDAKGEHVRDIRLRRSYDSQTYVGYVTGDHYFMHLFDGMTVGQLANLDFKAAKIEGVSGATETSWSLAEGLKLRAASIIATPAEAEAEAAARHRWLAALQRIRWRWQDTGHLLIIGSAFVMAYTRLRGIAWVRHLHHLLLVGYGGCIASEMLSQALLVGWAQHGTPWRSAAGLVLLGVVALLAPVFTRRQIYCHHLCPHGAAQQLLARRLRWQWRVPAKVSRWLEAVPFALLAAVLAARAWAWQINLNELEPFDAYSLRVAGVATLLIAALGLVASLFVPMAYCRYGCPTGAVFKLLRFTGDHDRLGTRDWLALGLMAAAYGARGWM
jgi:hypothetical protein